MLKGYLFKHYLKLFFGFFFIFFTLTFLVNSSTRFGQFSYLNPKAIEVYFYSLLQMPTIVKKLMPFIILFSAMAHFIKLNDSRELVILRSAGFSIWQIIFPACCSAFLLGICAIIILNPLINFSQDQLSKNLQNLQHNVKNQNFDSQSIWFLQNYKNTRTIFGAYHYDTTQHKLNGTTIIQEDSNGRIIWYEAPEAILKDGFWYLPQAYLYQIGQEPLLLNGKTLPTKITNNFLKDYLQDSQTTLFYQLPYKAKLVESFGGNGKVFETEFSIWIALPFLLIIMVLLAACVSLRFSRFPQKRSLLTQGLGAGFFTYVLTVICQNLGEKGFILPSLAGAIPVIVGLFIALPLLLQQEEG